MIIKILNKLVIEENFLNMIKGIYENLLAKNSLWKTECFLPRSGIRQGYLLLSLLFSVVLEVLFSTARQENKLKDIQSRKEKVKLPVCRWYVENPKGFTHTKKLLELMDSARLQDARSAYKNQLYFHMLVHWTIKK